MLRPHTLLFSLALLASFAAAGCSKVGQSGSEVLPGHPMDPAPATPDEPFRPHCPCDQFHEYLQIRATVVGIEAFPAVGTQRYELVANELLGPDPTDKNEIAVSDHFGGYWSGNLGCGGMIPAPIATGDEVVAFFRRGRQDDVSCCEYIACADPCRINGDAESRGRRNRPPARQACAASSATACAKHQPEALLHGELLLIPWGDSLLVGRSDQASASISSDQLPALNESRAQCSAELPDLEATLYPASQPSADGKSASDGEPASVAGSGASAANTAPLPPPILQCPRLQAAPAEHAVRNARERGPALPAAGSGASNAAAAAPANVTTSVSTPPPAGPEEIRVRCVPH